jgi:transcriptional regulator with XRE-family HTH domain
MKNHIKSESIKERINHLLSTQATTKTALAHAIGMDVSQLSKLLNKQGTIPVDYIEPWAECLGIDVNELINSQQTISKKWVRPHAHIHLDIDVDIEYVESILNIVKNL